MTSSNILLYDAMAKYDTDLSVSFLQNFESKISPYIIRQNKKQLITLYSMNAPN